MHTRNTFIMLRMPTPRASSDGVGLDGYVYCAYNGLGDVDVVLGASRGPSIAPAADNSNGKEYGNSIYPPRQYRGRASPSLPGLAAVSPRKPAPPSDRSGKGKVARLSISSAFPKRSAEDGTPSTATAGGHPAILTLSDDGDSRTPNTAADYPRTRKMEQTDQVMHLPVISDTAQSRTSGDGARTSRANRHPAALEDFDATAGSSTTPKDVHPRRSGSSNKSATGSGRLNFRVCQNVRGSQSFSARNCIAETVTAQSPPHYEPALSPLVISRPNDESSSTTAATHAISISLQPPLDPVVRRGNVAVGKDSSVGNGHLVGSIKASGCAKNSIQRVEKRTNPSDDAASSRTRTTPVNANSPYAGPEARPTIQRARRELRQEYVRDAYTTKARCGIISTQNTAAADPAHGAGGTRRREDRLSVTGEGPVGVTGGAVKSRAQAMTHTQPAVASPQPHVWAGDYELAMSMEFSTSAFADVPLSRAPPPTQNVTQSGAATPAKAMANQNGNGYVDHRSPQHPSSKLVQRPTTVHDKTTPRHHREIPHTSGGAVAAKSSTGTLPPHQRNGSRVDGATSKTLPVALNGSTTRKTSATDSESSVSSSSQALGSSRSGTTSVLSSSLTSSCRGKSNVHTTSHDHQAHQHSSSKDMTRDDSLLSDWSSVPSMDLDITGSPGLPYSDKRRAALEVWADVPVLTFTMRGESPSPMQLLREEARARKRPAKLRQMCTPVNGQGVQEPAGEPFEMNYNVHNIIVQLRHRNRPPAMDYPLKLPVEVNMRPCLRRQLTPRSFYGKRLKHVGDGWYKDALKDARLVLSPDLEALEKQEEEEFIRNGGDPAQRRNRYGQAGNPNGQPQHGDNRGAGRVAEDRNSIDAINHNVVRVEQTAS